MNIKTAFKATIIATSIAGPALADYEPEGWRADAVDQVKLEAKQVLEAYWSQPISFWAFVRDNGKNRDGLAGVLCYALDSAGRPEGEFVAITIWAAFTRDGDGLKQLGKATCT